MPGPIAKWKAVILNGKLARRRRISTRACLALQGPLHVDERGGDRPRNGYCQSRSFGGPSVLEFGTCMLFIRKYSDWHGPKLKRCRFPPSGARAKKERSRSGVGSRRNRRVSDQPLLPVTTITENAGSGMTRYTINLLVSKNYTSQGHTMMHTGSMAG